MRWILLVMPILLGMDWATLVTETKRTPEMVVSKVAKPSAGCPEGSNCCPKSAVKTKTEKKYEVQYWHASWCKPCKSMDPWIEDLQAEGYPVKIASLEEHRKVAEYNGVTRVPSLILIIDGKQTSWIEGWTTEEVVRKWLNKYGVPKTGAQEDLPLPEPPVPLPF